MGGLLDAGLRQVQQALAQIPDGKRFVWVTTVDAKGTIRAGMAVRSDAGDWGVSLGAEGQWTPTGREAGDTVFIFVKVER